MSAKKYRPCKCGCGQDTGHRRRTWVPGHMPDDYKARVWTKERHTWAYYQRLEVFEEELVRLGPRFTRRALLAVLNDVRVRAYRTGYQKGQKFALDKRKDQSPQHDDQRGVNFSLESLTFNEVQQGE
jgi:hypothetical protein